MEDVKIIIFDIGGVLIDLETSLEIKENVNLLERLFENKYRLFAITDAPKHLVELERKKFKFYNYFEDVFLPGEKLMKKTDGEAYKFFMESRNLNISQSIFIDDRLENIEAAKSIGMKSTLYNSPLKLYKKLEPLLDKMNCSM